MQCEEGIENPTVVYHGFGHTICMLYGKCNVSYSPEVPTSITNSANISIVNTLLLSSIRQRLHLLIMSCIGILSIVLLFILDISCIYSTWND